MSESPIRVAYLVSRYPAVTHTFVLGEVRALRDAGVQVQTMSVRRASEKDVLSDVDRQEASTTHALLPAPVGRLLADHARAFVRHPMAYTRTLAHALALSTGGARALLWQLFYFAEAIMAWSWLRNRGIRHLHVHFANPASDVAMLTTRFGSAAAGRGERWTWSVTMHG